MNDALITTKSKLSEFYATQRKYSKFGATDSEAIRALWKVLRFVVLGEDYKIPALRDDWGLYDDMYGATGAAQALTLKAEEVVKAILSADHNERGELKRYILSL